MQFSRTSVLYFSPTGGTRHVAEIMAQELGVKDIYDITVNCYGLTFEKDELVVFCFPVYSGRVPPPMIERMKMIDSHGAHALLIAVFGNRAIDDALIEMGDLAFQRGFNVVGGMQVIAPHSLNHSVAAGRPDAADREKIHEFFTRFNAKENFRAVTMPGSRPYRKYVPVPVRAFPGRDCMLCCTCAKECPAGAIEGPKAMKISKCIGCMRCVYVCPMDNRQIPAPIRKATEASVKAVASGRKEVEYWL